MSRLATADSRRDAVIKLMRELRRLDDGIGVKHSGIALDVGLLLYEIGECGLSVRSISAQTGYSGPTVRLVLTRLRRAGSLRVAAGAGKTQVYCITPQGRTGFDSYVETILAFAERIQAQDGRGLSAAAAPAPDQGPPGGPQPPQAPHAGAPPATAAPD